MKRAVPDQYLCRLYSRLAPPQLGWSLLTAQVADGPTPTMQESMPLRAGLATPLPRYEENWNPPVKGAPSSVLRSTSMTIATGTWLPVLMLCRDGKGAAVVPVP